MWNPSTDLRPVRIEGLEGCPLALESQLEQQLHRTSAPEHRLSEPLAAAWFGTRCLRNRRSLAVKILEHPHDPEEQDRICRTDDHRMNFCIGSSIPQVWKMWCT